MKMTTLFLATAGFCLLATAAPGQTTGGQGATNQGAVMQDRPAGTAPGARSTPLGDAEFVRRAVIANRFEIEEAQLALAQGADPRLKEFARAMVLDHGAALKDLDDAIALLSAYQQSGKSEQLRAWAIKARPVVGQHREALGALNTQ